MMPGAKDQGELANAVQTRPETVRDNVRRLASDAGNIRWSEHCLARMEERGITDRTAVEVLRHGDLKGNLEPGQSPGEWKLKMVRAVRGRREVGVVVVTLRNEKIFVKTVEWEDVR